VKSLTPNFKRLNPLSKLRELPRQNIRRSCRRWCCCAVRLGGLWYRPGQLEHAVENAAAGGGNGARQMAISVQSLLWKAAMLFVILGAVDLWRQKPPLHRDLRMSKQDLREESKEMEGNPQIRGRLRQLRREMAEAAHDEPGSKPPPCGQPDALCGGHSAMSWTRNCRSDRGRKGRNFVAQRIRLLASITRCR